MVRCSVDVSSPVKVPGNANLVSKTGHLLSRRVYRCSERSEASLVDCYTHMSTTKYPQSELRQILSGLSNEQYVIAATPFTWRQRPSDTQSGEGYDKHKYDIQLRLAQL